MKTARHSRGTLGAALALLGLAAMVFAGCAGQAGYPAAASAAGPRQSLSAEEAVDLARFRGWKIPGGAGYVPRPRQALVAQVAGPEATAFLERTDRPETDLDPALRDPNMRTWFVVVRGPVVDRLGEGANTLGDSLALVIDLQGVARYVRTGSPWDTIDAPHAQSVPLHDAPQLHDVSLPFAQSWFGKVVQPAGMPGGLTPRQIDVNRGTSVDPSGATFVRDGPPYEAFDSVTIIYADGTGRQRVWLSQAVSLASPRVEGPSQPVQIGSLEGRRYLWERNSHKLVALAWQQGNRALYLAADLGPDLTEKAVLAIAASIQVQEPAPAIAPTARPSPAAETQSAGACPVTPRVYAEPPSDKSADPFGLAYWYVNADRTIWAGPLLKDGAWSTRGDKVLWIRPAGTQLVITGRRLDGDAPPLQADVPCCYLSGFQATGLNFPTPGCWEVSATAGDSKIRFITRIVASP